MPIRTAIWKVGKQPEPLLEASLPKEHLLEEMILADPRILSEEWMLIGRQEPTFGGYLDLLAIAPDGSLVLVELKRDRTPREVVAQAIDYASWVEKLGAEDVAAIYGRFAPGRSLSEQFRQRFGQDLDEDTLNANHQIIIVAGSLDDSTERIVGYLSGRDIPINVLCFQVFSHGHELLLSRVWLRDPVHAQISTPGKADRSKEPWNGEFYCSFGHGDARSWPDAVEFGFISGGSSAWYSRTLQLLSPGDRVWVNVPGRGYTGVGRVAGHALPATDFVVKTPTGDLSVLEAAKGGSYHREFVNDLERCEYFVPVRWLETAPLDRAVKEIGFFGNKNTVCRPSDPKWRFTVDRLKERFPNFDK